MPRRATAVAAAARANRFDVHADRTDAALTAESVRRSRARVKDELGDLLFDVLMLACVCERRFGAGDGDAGRRQLRPSPAPRRHAAQKSETTVSPRVRPLAGPAATRAEEEAEWKKAKASEKAAVAAGAALPPAPPTRRG